MRMALFLFTICLLFSIPNQASPQEATNPNAWTGNINLFFGAKFLEKDNWEPVDKHIEGGVLIDFRQKRWPISIAIDFLYSGDEEDIEILELGVGTSYVKVKSRTMEFDLGVRKIWGSLKHFRPFVGGGLAIINGNLKSETFGESVSEDDTGFGIWVDGGIYISLSGHFNLGIDGRWSKAEAYLFDEMTRIGGWHIGALVGFHW